jgi:hypothetical protein
MFLQLYDFMSGSGAAMGGGPHRGVERFTVGTGNARFGLPAPRASPRSLL